MRIRNLENGNSPTLIKVDLAHTYAIAGFGKDELASTLFFIGKVQGLWR